MHMHICFGRAAFNYRFGPILLHVKIMLQNFQQNAACMLRSIPNVQVISYDRQLCLLIHI